MPSNLPLVVTIHGINSDGDWQEQFREVANHHFHCESYKYRDYRYGGFTLQFIAPIWGLIGAAGLGTAVGVALGDAGSLAANWPAGGENSRAWLGLSKGLAVRFGPPLFALVLLIVTLNEAARGPRMEPLHRPGKYSWNAILSVIVVFVAVIVAWVDPLAMQSIWLLLLLPVGLVIALLALFELWWPKDFENRAMAYVMPLGCVSLAIWIGMVLGASAHAVIGWTLRESVSEAQWVWWLSLAGAVVFALLALGAAVTLAPLRRRKRVEHFRMWLLSTIREHKRGRAIVHVIAHSFGTYLLGEVLKNEDKRGRPLRGEQRVRVNRIILVGSVLETKYPWKDVLGEKGSYTFDHVRNEAGGRDWIVRLAGFTQRLPIVRGIGFGNSGLFGFAREGQEDFVHNVRNSLEFCESCITREDRHARRVHNVFLRLFFHSDAFTAFDRAERLWLPFLAEIEPMEYWEFRRLCDKARAYEDEALALVQRIKELANEMEDARIKWMRAKNAKSSSPTMTAKAKQRLDEAIAQRQEAISELDEVKQRSKSVERQFCEQIYDWTESQDRFQDFVVDRIASKFFEAYRTQPGVNEDSYDMIIRCANLLVFSVIRNVWKQVWKGLRALAQLKKERRDQATTDAASSQASVRAQDISLLHPLRAVDAGIDELLQKWNDAVAQSTVADAVIKALEIFPKILKEDTTEEAVEKALRMLRKRFSPPVGT